MLVNMLAMQLDCNRMALECFRDKALEKKTMTNRLYNFYSGSSWYQHSASTWHFRWSLSRKQQRSAASFHRPSTPNPKPYTPAHAIDCNTSMALVDTRSLNAFCSSNEALTKPSPVFHVFPPSFFIPFTDASPLITDRPPLIDGRNQPPWPEREGESRDKSHVS